MSSTKFYQNPPRRATALFPYCPPGRQRERPRLSRTLGGARRPAEPGGASPPGEPQFPTFRTIISRPITATSLIAIFDVPRT